MVNEKDFDNSYNESNDDVPLSMRVQYFVDKDGTKWFRKKPTQNIRTIQQNLVTEKIRRKRCGQKCEIRNRILGNIFFQSNN